VIPLHSCAMLFNVGCGRMQVCFSAQLVEHALIEQNTIVR
jgi:hypothetical protein